MAQREGKRERNGTLAGQALLHPWRLSHLGTKCSGLGLPFPCSEPETAQPDPRNAVAHL